jgi:protease-4
MAEGQLSRGLWPWSGGENLLARLAEELDKAAQDEAVKALLVKIDSPGGTTAAADLIHHQLRLFRERTKRPLVALLMGLAASGGYYAALAADEIHALPSTLTGSIGVISLRLNIAGLMERLGVQAEAVKTGPHKDMWSLFRPAGEEERRIMEGLIDSAFTRFKGLVAERRPRMSPVQVAQASDGRLFTAAQALALGLIDGLAYPDQAFEAAKRLAGLKEASLVVYHREGARRASLYAAVEGPEQARPDLLTLSGGPYLMYLWLPGAGLRP